MEVKITIRYRVPSLVDGLRRSSSSIAAGGCAALRIGMIALLFLGPAIIGLEACYGFLNYSTVARAAKLGAIYGEIHREGGAAIVDRALLTKEIEQIVRDNTSDLDAEPLNVAATWTDEGSDESAVRVRVTYPYRSFTGSLMRVSDRFAAVLPPLEMVVTN